MLDLGSIYGQVFFVRDATGALANATTVVVTVTLPDGTTVTPTVANPPATTGNYLINYQTTQAGHHIVNGLSTSPNSAYSDVFNVRGPAIGSLVSLADVKDSMNIPQSDTSLDTELRGYIATATHIIEHEVGACSRRTVVDTFTGTWTQPVLVPRTQPIISITSVTEKGVTLDPAGDYQLTPLGTVIRTIGGGGTLYTRGWWYGVNDVVITYVAGRAIIPANILEAALRLVGLHARPQLGGEYAPFDTADTPGQGTTILGFYVPRSVVDLLIPHVDVAAGIA